MHYAQFTMNNSQFIIHNAQLMMNGELGINY